MFNRIMYPLRINYKYTIYNIYLVARIVVPSNDGLHYCGLDNMSVSKRYGLQLSQLGSVWFGIHAGFCLILRFVNGARLWF